MRLCPLRAARCFVEPSQRARGAAPFVTSLVVFSLLGCETTPAEVDGGIMTAMDAGVRDPRDAGVLRDAGPSDAAHDSAVPPACIPAGGAAVKIACVGDSITFGYDLAPSEAYPSVLATLLGPDFEVGNFGQNGVTALENGDNPIRGALVFTQSTTFAPDVVVIQLGTNDSKPDNWVHEADFEAHYRALVQYYRDLGAQVYVSLPPPAYMNTSYWQIEDVIPHLRAVAADTGAPLIDVHAALSGHPEYFPIDGVHPNAAGAVAIAETIADALRADLCP